MYNQEVHHGVRSAFQQTLCFLFKSSQKKPKLQYLQYTWHTKKGHPINKRWKLDWSRHLPGLDFNWDVSFFEGCPNSLWMNPGLVRLVVFQQSTNHAFRSSTVLAWSYRHVMDESHDSEDAGSRVGAALVTFIKVIQIHIEVAVPISQGHYTHWIS